MNGHPSFPSKTFLGVAVLALAMTTSACRQDTRPATISVTVPTPNSIQTQVNLTQRFGLGLSINVPIIVEGVNYGSVYAVPESPASGFGFGFTLNTSTFLRESWVNYREVTALPTGDAFPSWMGGAVVDFVVPPANIPELKWHLYIGTRGQFYVGLASQISAIGGGFPSLRIEYNFYDDQGRVVIGLVFFGPKIQNGRVLESGGIFVGTNITPFLPPEMQNIGTVGSAQMALSSSQLTSLISAASRGRPIKINGKSVTSDIAVSGRDSGRYRSAQSIQGLVDRYMAASRIR